MQWTGGLTFSELTKTMSQKKVNDGHAKHRETHKKDKSRDSKGTKRPLTSIVVRCAYRDEPALQLENQRAHKVKPTQSFYTQLQR